MSRPTFPELHEKPKILIRAISDGLNTTFDDNSFFIDQKLIICSHRQQIENFLVKKPKSKIYEKANLIDNLSTIGFLNSKLSSFYYKKMLKGGVSVLPEDIRQFPIYPYHIKRNQIKEIVSEILTKNQLLHKKQNRFQKRLTDNLTPMGHDPLNGTWKLSKKLKSFYNHDFKTFVKELKKKKIKLSLIEQDEWEDYFNAYTNEIKALQTEINRIDKEIDMMVYELYGLTDEEIKIVENS